MADIPGFERRTVDAEGLPVFAAIAGDGPPLLLLHGFPQTHLMWREVAPRLAEAFTVVCMDLPGYGRSGCPRPEPDHAPHSKRAMAAACLGAMRSLGLPRFAVAGHDRGGRVAFRLGLDHPDAVTAVVVMDVIPTQAAWERADARLALSFWPWSLLAQPAPLPERLLAGAPDAVVDDALSNWGSPASTFRPEVRAAYVESLRDPATIEAICEEYRAAAGIDREHDEADRKAGRRLRPPLLALWSAAGGLGNWYEAEGGPLAIWREWAEDLQGEGLAGGHFFPEENPTLVADRLRDFLIRMTLARPDQGWSSARNSR